MKIVDIQFPKVVNIGEFLTWSLYTIKTYFYNFKTLYYKNVFYIIAYLIFSAICHMSIEIIS